MHKFYFIAGLAVLLACLFHTSPWIYFATSESPYLSYPLPEALNLVGTTHYLTLERAFWSSLLAGLAICLLGESYLGRPSAATRAES